MEWKRRKVNMHTSRKMHNMHLERWMGTQINKWTAQNPMMVGNKSILIKTKSMIDMYWWRNHLYVFYHCLLYIFQLKKMHINIVIHDIHKAKKNAKHIYYLIKLWITHILSSFFGDCLCQWRCMGQTSFPLSFIL